MQRGCEPRGQGESLIFNADSLVFDLEKARKLKIWPPVAAHRRACRTSKSCSVRGKQVNEVQILTFNRANLAREQKVTAGINWGRVVE